MIISKPCPACDVAKPTVEMLAKRFANDITFVHVDDTAKHEALDYYLSDGQGWPLYVSKDRMGNIRKENINPRKLEQFVASLL